MITGLGYCNDCIHNTNTTPPFYDCYCEELVKYVQAWHPDKLPDWIHLRILTAFVMDDAFGCTKFSSKNGIPEGI